jgi:hypothetical protein
MGFRDFFSRNRKFESISLQRRVHCEPNFLGDFRERAAPQDPDPTYESQFEVSRNVLREIGAEVVPSRLLLNKIDRVSEADRGRRGRA